MSSSSLNFATTCYMSDVGSSTQVLCYSSTDSLYGISFITICVLLVMALGIYFLKGRIN